MIANMMDDWVGSCKARGLCKLWLARMFMTLLIGSQAWTCEGLEVPSIPTTLVGEGVSAYGFEIAWTPPAENGGSDITEYVVRYREIGGTGYTEISRRMDQLTLLLRNGGDPTPPLALIPSTIYEIEVVAVNMVGRGDPISTTVITQSIEQPQKIFDPLLLSNITPLTAVVSWMHPGGTVINFRIQYKLSFYDWLDAAFTNISVPGNMTSVTLHDLLPETLYHVRVRTENNLGSSVFSLETSFATALPPPPIVDGPTTILVGETAQINCTSPISSLPLTWFRLVLDPESPGQLILSFLSSRATTVGTDLVFHSPTVMDTGIYACQVGASVRTLHNLTVVAPPPSEVTAMITPSGSPMAGQSFSLTCSVTGADSLNHTIFYTWFKGQLQVSNSSVLNFDSLFLSDAGQYNCTAIIMSVKGELPLVISRSYDIQFATLNIQLRFGGLLNCTAFTQSDTKPKTREITDQLLQAMGNLCRCGFNSSHVSDSFIRCFDASPHHVTYRAVLTRTPTVSTVQLVSLITQWLTIPGILVQSIELSTDRRCPLVIADLDSPECPKSLTTRSQPTPNVEPMTLNIGAIVGGVIAGLVCLVLLALVSVVTCAVVFLSRRSKRTERPGTAKTLPLENAPTDLQHNDVHEAEKS